MHAKHSICLCSMSSAEKALEEGVAPKWWLNMTELCSIPIFLIKPSSLNGLLAQLESEQSILWANRNKNQIFS